MCFTDIKIFYYFNNIIIGFGVCFYITNIDLTDSTNTTIF